MKCNHRLIVLMTVLSLIATKGYAIDRSTPFEMQGSLINDGAHSDAINQIIAKIHIPSEMALIRCTE